MEKLIEVVYYTATQQQQSQEMEESEAKEHEQKQEEMEEMMVEEEEETTFVNEDDDVTQYEEVQTIEIDLSDAQQPQHEEKKPVSLKKFVKRPRSIRSKDSVPVKREHIVLEGPFELPLAGNEIEAVENWINESQTNYETFVQNVYAIRWVF